MARRGDEARRARLVIAVASALVLIAGATVAGFFYAHAASSNGTPTPSRSTSTSSPPDRSTATSSPPDRSTTTTAPAPTEIGTYAVATTSLVVTVPGALPTETKVPATVWYPGAPIGAHGEVHRRTFPLLMFSQGFDVAVQSYVGLLDDWASAGFVVAAPTYPHTQPSSTPTPATPPSLLRSDIIHHPADLNAVLNAVVTADAAASSPLDGLIDTSEIGLVGQSDGGNVSLAVADNSCCRVDLVKAVAVLSGAEMTTFGGQYFPPGTSSPPILVAQGDKDTINPASCSEQIYDAAPQPKYFLDLLGATHLGPYTQTDAYQSVVAAVTTDFFDAELAHESAGIPAMASDGDVPGTSQLVDTPTVSTVPNEPGECLGAPAASP